MKTPRWLEVLTLLALIAGAAIVFSPPKAPPVPEPHDKPVRSVNGVQLGMTLEQARAAVGHGFRTIQLDELHHEFRGEGKFPVAVIVKLDRRSGLVESVTGTDLRFGKHRLLARQWRREFKWLERYPKHTRSDTEVVWHFPNVTAWTKLGGSSLDPISVGLTRGDKLPPPPPDPVSNEGSLSREYFAVDGVQLGMTRAEVIAVLGVPDDDGGERWLEYKTSTQELPTAIAFDDARVSSAEGINLSYRGKPLASARAELAPVIATLGEAQDFHAYGAGGSKVHCWSDRRFALEVLEHEPEDESPMVTRVFLFDPRKQLRDHLWYTSCGAP